MAAPTSRDSKSLANNFEVMLKEMGVSKGSPVEKKVNAVFRILDELVPKLGVYSVIMEMVGKELYESVYSDQLTTVKDNPEPQRVPYFSLVRRIEDKNDQRVEQLEDQVEDLRTRLFAKHTTYEESLLKMVELKNDIHELETEISDLKDVIAQRDEQINELEENARYELEKTENVRIGLEDHIKDVKDDLNEANEEIKFLYKYKDAYDDLQEAFEDKASDIPNKKKRRNPVVATKRAHLISDIEQAYKLEEQLLAIENIAIEDFDQMMEEHKTVLMEGDVNDPDAMTSDELRLKSSRFRTSIDDLNLELDLLQSHRIMLEEQLQIMEESKPAAKLREKRRKQKRMKESAILEGLDPEPDEGISSDPFTVQERVFSKYSAMIYTSADEGRSYHEIGTAAYCTSCGEKTVVCPHKIARKDRIFKIPRSTTHIKVVRPKVRINQEAMDALFKPFQTPSRIGSAIDKKSSLGDPRPFESQSPMTDSKTDNELEFGDESSTTSRTPVLREALTPASSTIEASMKYPLSLMWDDFRARTDLMRQVPRTLPLKRTLSMLEQFMAYTLHEDEQIEGDDGYHCFIENLYYFLIARYGKEDVGFLVAHDIFAALSDFASNHKLVQVFAHCLVGNLDATVMRYILVLADFIAVVDWQRVEDFRAFAGAVYPFCTEDDIETLHMGYVSFTKNKISPDLVMNYLLYVILRGREPRLQEFELKLFAIPTQEPQMMSCKEYLEALDLLLSLPDDGISKRLYKEAEGTVILIEGKEDCVPIQKVAHIASYLAVLEVLPVMKEDVVKKIREARERPSSRDNGKLGQSSLSQVAPPDGELLTFSAVKNLAAQLAGVMYAPPSQGGPAREVEVNKLNMISEMEEESRSPSMASRSEPERWSSANESADNKEERPDNTGGSRDSTEEQGMRTDIVEGESRMSEGERSLSGATE